VRSHTWASCVPPGRAAVPGSADARPGGVVVHAANHQETPLSASQRSSTKIAGCRHQEPISSLPEHPKARLYGLLFISRLRGGRKARLGKKQNTESWGLLFFLRRLKERKGAWLDSGKRVPLGPSPNRFRAVGGRGLRVEPCRQR
jgi:hypothetical protein